MLLDALLATTADAETVISHRIKTLICTKPLVIGQRNTAIQETRHALETLF